MSDLTATELASRLGVSRRHAVDLLADGAITGRKLSSGAWLADADSVLRYEASARRGGGRTLDADTAWGLLWELSGLDAAWLTRSTLSRTRGRLRAWTAEELARAVSGRTRAHRYRAANASKVGQELIATGRAAAGQLRIGLMNDTRQVCGYVRHGDVGEYARQHFMAASNSGQDVLYENTLPVTYDGEAMPAAVIAADLAISTDTRERSGGLRALDELRNTWLAAN
ncbi:hypothetical protein [uncultured Microbacterium sp.]|uniref:hypothetical protein n=1 Tax=uncultured Microbacterium sp. TaxID=191216 RepID=UPI0028E2B01B|nr:hypothetical protein [uncultured Microbacterium sp.]